MTSSYGAIRVQLRKSSKKRPAPASPPPSIARSLGSARFSLDALAQPRDLRLVEQAADDARAVALELAPPHRGALTAGFEASAPSPSHAVALGSEFVQGPRSYAPLAWHDDQDTDHAPSDARSTPPSSAPSA